MLILSFRIFKKLVCTGLQPLHVCETLLSNNENFSKALKNTSDDENIWEDQETVGKEENKVKSKL
jgi:hypothetical protein